MADFPYILDLLGLWDASCLRILFGFEGEARKILPLPTAAFQSVHVYGCLHA